MMAFPPSGDPPGVIEFNELLGTVLDRLVNEQDFL